MGFRNTNIWHSTFHTQPELRRISTKRIGDGELFTNPNRGWVLDLFVSGHSAGSLRGWVVIDAVLGAFAEQDASVPFQVTNQISAFHILGN